MEKDYNPSEIIKEVAETELSFLTDRELFEFISDAYIHRQDVTSGINLALKELRSRGYEDTLNE